ncbi:MAG: transporter [Hyphomicrobiaceae bacterium]
MKRTVALWVGAGLALAINLPTTELKAAEGAAGFYLLGSRTTMAGFLPPPGTYVQDLKYYYKGDSSVPLNIGGIDVTGGISADVFYDIPIGIWVAPRKVLGGNFALSLMVPIGWKDVSAGLTLPAVGVGRSRQDDDIAFGDPVPGATLGWHDGNWHWNVGVLVNTPIGFWKQGNLANIGFNRWAFDTNAAVTWLDTNRGLEISAAAGFTFNVENPDTDYKTGTEFHLEWAITQNLSKTFGVGLVGYHYQQVSGDSGAGAALGPFEGRVTALGPNINYTLMCGQIPISTSFRYLKEFNVKNRLEGDAFLFSASMPLSVTGR